MYDDDLDALAAEYVLGTLSADERGHAEALLVIDPGFGEIVRQWERRLGELNVMVEAVEPPGEVWDKIKAEVGSDGSDHPARLPHIGEFVPPAGAEAEEPSPVAALASSLLPPEPEDAEPLAPPETSLEAELKQATAPLAPPPPARIERSKDTDGVARRLRRWRRWALLMTALVLLLGAFIAVSQVAPGWLGGRNPMAPVFGAAKPAQPQPPASRLVAVLGQEPVSPAFVVSLDPESRNLTVRRLTAAAPAGHSYALWLLAKKFAVPVSLGIVGSQEFTHLQAPANVDTDTMRAARYEVTLETSGGSNGGMPAGPVLFTGTMFQSLPDNPPPSK